MRDIIDINSNDNVLFVTSQCSNRCICAVSLLSMSMT